MGAERRPTGVVVDVFGASVAAELAQRSLMHPVDTIKARLQYMRLAKPETAARPLLPPWSWRLPLLGDVAALRQVLQGPAKPGAALRVGSLYRGLAPALVGVLPNALVYMPTYEFSKQALASTSFAPLSGAITGCVCACVRVPVSVIKSRVQLQLYDTPLAALRATISGPAGYRGLYAGLGATLVHDISYATVQFALLEQLRLAADGWVGGRPLTAAEDGAVGFTVGLCTAAVTEPLDLVRTRLMAQKQPHQASAPAAGAASAAGAGRAASGAGVARSFGYTGVYHGLRSAAMADGVAALWRGLLPRLVLKSFGSSVWYTVYMASRRHLSERREAGAGR